MNKVKLTAFAFFTCGLGLKSEYSQSTKSSWARRLLGLPERNVGFGCGGDGLSSSLVKISWTVTVLPLNLVAGH